MLTLRKPKVLRWTHHARGKMRYYKLSEQRVRRVLHSPKRVEEGIAPKTVAMMQPASATWDMRQGTRKEKWAQEIWAMIQNKRQGTGNKRHDITIVISAWRYPGVTKPGAPLPEAVLREISAGAALSQELEEKEKTREKMRANLRKWRVALRG